MSGKDIQAAPKWIVDKLSAQVRARLLFRREVEIDQAQPKSAFDEKTLEGLIAQRSSYEQQRTSMLRTMMALTFLMFFVSNGQSMTIPYFKIDLASVPGLNALIGFANSFTILMIAMTGVTIGAYGGLIDQFAQQRSNNTVVDPDIISASLSPQMLAMKILRVQFNTHHPVYIVPKAIGSFVYGCAVHSVVLAIFGTAILVYLYTIYFLVAQVPNNYFGIGAKSLSLFFLTSSAIISIAANWDFAQRVYFVDPTEIDGIVEEEKAARKGKPKKKS